MVLAISFFSIFIVQGMTMGSMVKISNQMFEGLVMVTLMSDLLMKNL
jgi:hypothetical protein